MSELQTVSPGGSIADYAAPLFIAWQINSECNLDCLHCCEEAGLAFPDRMDREQMLDFCRQCAEARVPYVALSGGEPLLCPHLWDVCRLLRDHDVDVKIETNGEFIDAQTAERLGRLKLRSVQISLDGATAEAHEAMRRRGDWEKVLGACRLLRQQGVNTEIVFVPTQFNIHQVGDAVDLAASLGAGGFYTGKIMRIGRAAQNWEMLQPSPEQYEEFFEALSAKAEQYEGRMKVYYYPYDVVEELRYRLQTPAASLLVLPNGKVKLIGPLPFLCGDLKVAPLSRVWANYKKAWTDERVVSFARRVVEEPALLSRANNWVELW